MSHIGGTRIGVLVIVDQNGVGELNSNSETVCILLCTNSLGKGINEFLLLSYG